MIKLYMPALLVLNQISYLGGTSPSKVFFLGCSLYGRKMSSGIPLLEVVVP